jgi:hypothetical protein
MNGGEYPIEKDVPLEGNHYKRSADYGKLIAAMRAMVIGDSILVPIEKRYGIHARAKLIGIWVTTRQENLEQIRVWRIK